MLEFDHVVIAVPLLSEAAERIEFEHGLASVPGGRHVGHGTANVIVPLGPAYLELVAVVAEGEAARSPFGRWIGKLAADGQERLAALCVRSDDIGAVARRLALEPTPMSRRRPDGVELSWRLAGLDRAITDGLPFYIEWDIDEGRHPGRSSAPHRVQPIGISWVALGGDPEGVASWLGPHELGIRFIGGDPGVRQVAVATVAGEIVLS